MILTKRPFFLLAAVGAAVATGPLAQAADWPQWRCDPRRTANSTQTLPAKLQLQWVRELPPPRPAWPKYLRTSFDASYEPVVLGKTMFVGSMVSDSITALDSESGAVRWTFYAGGPIRFAPVAQRDRLYFVCDDGCLYCLDAATGRLRWQFRGTPPKRADRSVLGNDRLISLFPARGGPVLSDGKIYFGAGVFPFEGVAVHCVDAETGKPIWTSDELGFIGKGLLDHQLVREGGIGPLGYLTLLGDKLFVPGGRAKAAILDRRTGKLQPYSSDWGGRQFLHKGSWYVCGTQDKFFSSGDLFDLASGKRLQVDPGNDKELGEFREPVLAGNIAYCSLPINRMLGYHPAGAGYQGVFAMDLSQTPRKQTLQTPAKTRVVSTIYQEQWRLACPMKVHLKSGSRLYAGAKGTVAAIEIPGSGGKPVVSWQAAIEGTPSRMLSADDRLFVVTQAGSIYAFGSDAPLEHPSHWAPVEQEPALPVLGANRTFGRAGVPPLGSASPPKGGTPARAGWILDATGVRDGYCVVLGVRSGHLAEQLARQSRLHIIVLAADDSGVAELRARLGEAGLYGSRVAVHVAPLRSNTLPPYLASLIVSEDSAETGSIEQLRSAFRLLRPYGGTACVVLSPQQRETFAATVRSGLSQAELAETGELSLLKRAGPLPGSADWTHENADAGGSLVSSDRCVKPPLGVLWFGGAIDMLFPEWDFTHTRPPTPLVAGGRMLLQVAPKLHAVDVYTGRHLWSFDLSEGNIKQDRHNVNCVAGDNRVYVVGDRSCYALDAATGRRIRDFPRPQAAPAWREARVWNNRLVLSTGASLAVFDSHSGKQQWDHRATHKIVGFAVGNGRLYCADAVLPDPKGPPAKAEGRLLALDLVTGKTLWTAGLDMEGAAKIPFRLAYSASSDLLLATRQKTSAFRGDKGTLLWTAADLPGLDQPMLHPERLFSQAGDMYDPQTGKRMAEGLWPAKRRGCTRVVGAQNMVLFRDAFASYYDLTHPGRTVFRGIRVGCTNDLIAADGLLCAPNYSDGCACNYSVYTSLAFFPLRDSSLEIPER